MKHIASRAWAGLPAGAHRGALLAGCGALPDKPARAALYDFGPGLVAGAAPPAAPAGHAAPLPTIALAEIDANSRLDGTQMLYRLGYADANELRPYGQSRWSQPPAQLLAPAPARGAGAAGHTVLGPEESATIARTEGRAARHPAPDAGGVQPVLRIADRAAWAWCASAPR